MSADEARPQTKAAAFDEPLELHYSWLQTLWSTALWALFAFWAIYVPLAGLLAGYGRVLIVFWPAVLIGGPLLLTFVGPLWHAWTYKGPVVTLDALGVIDRRKRKTPFIPWQDIGQISLGTGETARYLCVEFRRPDRSRDDPPRAGWLGAWYRRWRFLSDWNVNLGPLACRRLDVLRHAQRLHQQELRQRVVEKNRYNAQGWSGTL
jgi:hypothetical protein